MKTDTPAPAAKLQQTQAAHRVRRSLLFVPGSEPRKIQRAANSSADCLVFDLEDAVAAEEKQRARDLVKEALEETRDVGPERAVRINPPDSEHFSADLESVVAAGADTVLVPKTVGAPDLLIAARAVDAQIGADSATPRILALIETPAGLMRVAELAGVSPRLDGLCFGHVDFASEMGLPRADASQGVLHHARCQIAISAAALGVAAIDNVFLDVRDDDAFVTDARMGMELGFQGKLCIHPRQVELANSVYTPSPDEIAQAQSVVDAWKEATERGLAVIRLDDRMIDPPLVEIAERVLARARQSGSPAAGGTA